MYLFHYSQNIKETKKKKKSAAAGESDEEEESEEEEKTSTTTSKCNSESCFGLCCSVGFVIYECGFYSIEGLFQNDISWS